MKIAVASRDSRHVSGHAGKARRWLIFEAEPGRAPVACPPVELGRDEVFHYASEDAPHPLDGVAAVIAGSCGEGFLRKMQRRGITAAMTREPDPAKAVADWLDDRLSPPKPRPVMGLLCKLRDRMHTD